MLSIKTLEAVPTFSPHLEICYTGQRVWQIMLNKKQLQEGGVHRILPGSATWRMKSKGASRREAKLMTTTTQYMIAAINGCHI